ncbi:MAG: hypothetical protein WDM85_06620 [Caulobacteraceae bacterium]
MPSSFRILRGLISRLEDEATGEIKPSELHAQIPPGRIDEAKAAAAALGDQVWTKFPFVPGMHPMEGDAAELILNRTWRPALAVTGLEGAPQIQSAGNVLRPATAAKLSLRLPPTADAEKAGELLKTLLEADPPYGAKVTFSVEGAGQGWNAPALAPWLRASIDRASQAAFGRPAAMMGEGGSIPFMGMLGEKFPAAQSSSPVCSAPTPTPTAPTNSCTSPPARASAWPWPRCWRIIWRGTGTEPTTANEATRPADLFPLAALFAMERAMAKIIFADSTGRYDGRALETRALGGTESSVILTARGLARRGHDVTVHSNCEAELVHEGVRWRPLDARPEQTCDVYIAIQQPELLSSCRVRSGG